MSMIQTSQPGLIGKSAESAHPDISRIANAKDFDPQQMAATLSSLQRQIDFLTRALQANLPAPKQFSVADSNGGLIGWIGNAISGGISYLGAWFKQLYIGGTSPADAVIVADANGNVTINGATIELTANGTRTDISNVVNAWSSKAVSIESTDIASGMYSIHDPFNFALLSPSNVRIAALDSSPAGMDYVSSLHIGAASALDYCQVLTTGFLASDGGLNTGTLEPTFVLVSDGSDFSELTALHVDTPSYKVGGVPGIDASNTVVTAETPSTGSAVTSVVYGNFLLVGGITVSTTTISYTPGATGATLVSNVSASAAGASFITSVNSGSFVTGLTPTTVTQGFIKGLRTT